MTNIMRNLRFFVLAILLAPLPAFGAGETLARDGNGEAVCGGVDSTDVTKVLNFRVDPTTKEVLVKASCSVGGGVEDAAETAGGDLSMAGSVRRDTPASSAGTTGDNATINTDALGKVWVTSTYIEDAAETAGGGLMMMGSVRRDTKASSAGTAGDNATINTDANGGVWVAADVMEDAAETAGAPLVGIGTVRRDTAASSADTDGDNATLNTDGSGRLWANVGATVLPTPAAGLTCGQTDVTTAGTAVQLAANACKYVLVSCKLANTGDCFVAHATGDGRATGLSIPDGGAAARFDVANTNLLWVDATTSGDDVSWCCIN